MQDSEVRTSVGHSQAEYELRLLGREYSHRRRDRSLSQVAEYIRESTANQPSSHDHEKKGVLVFPGRTRIRSSGLLSVATEFDTMALFADRTGLTLDELFTERDEPSQMSTGDRSYIIAEEFDRERGVMVRFSYGEHSLQLKIPVSGTVQYHEALDPIASQQDFWLTVAHHARLELGQAGWEGRGLSTRFMYKSTLVTADGQELRLHFHRSTQDPAAYEVLVGIPRSYVLTCGQAKAIQTASRPDSLLVDSYYRLVDMEARVRHDIQAEFSIRPEGILTFLSGLKELESEVKGKRKRKRNDENIGYDKVFVG